MSLLIESVLDRVYDATRTICKLFLVAEIIITSMAVAGRYISFIPDPAWSEEMTLTCMIYMSFISASLAIRRKAHIRMLSFDKYLPVKLVDFVEIFDDLLVLAFSAMMLFVGLPFAISAGRASYVSMPWLSRFFLYAPVPISGAMMCVFQIEQLIKDILKLKGKEVANG